MVTRTDYFKLHFIVFLWGFSGILGKLVSIPAYEMVMIRSILAAAGIGAVMLYVGEKFSITKRQFINFILIGFIVGFHWVAFFEAARVSNVSVSLVGFATNSLWTALLVPIFEKTSLKKYEVMLGIVVITGLYVIFSFNFEYPLGLLLGVLAGFSAALFSIFNARFVKNVPAFTISFYEMIGAFLGLVLFLPVYKVTWANQGELQLLPPFMDWVYIIILTGACSVYAYSTAIDLMKKISVFLLQLTLNLEPVYGIVMAVLIFKHKEKMDLNFYLGTLIILSAVAIYPFLRKKYEKQVPINL
jgi:drug/metabolite transporter (DMT)-like permease